MKNLKVIFIHGNGATHWSSLWAGWLKEKLDKSGIENVFETFPDPKLARAKYWLPFLKDKLKADEKTLIVGFSSGATAAMRFAEDNKIFGSILISPCYTNLNLEEEEMSGWYDKDWNWTKIKENQKLIAMFFSKNDEVIPYEEFLHIKEKLNPNQVFEFENKGHFIKQNTFPELLEYIKEIFEI